MSEWNFPPIKKEVHKKGGSAATVKTSLRTSASLFARGTPRPFPHRKNMKDHDIRVPIFGMGREVAI
jgi:hypothetical protein